MTTDEQAVLQIINTYAKEGFSWDVSLDELCKLTTLEADELMQTLNMLKEERYIDIQTKGPSLLITITHEGHETALDAPQF